MNLQVSLDTAAVQALPPGFYGSTVVFFDFTGWDGEYVNLFIAQMDPNPVLQVSAGGAFQASGPNGGPFDPGSQSYELRNLGASPLNWSVSSTVSWLDFSQMSGQLASGASTTVVAQIDSGASQGLGDGTHPAQIQFNNLDTGQGDGQEPVVLTIQKLAERGRARVQGHNVLADNLSRLRGEVIAIADWNLDVMYNEAHWRELRDDFRLNAVRLMISAPPQNWSGGPGMNCGPPVYRCYDLDSPLKGNKTTLEVIEDMVDLAAKHGMYIVLDYHTVGGFDLAHALNWWGVVAERFKDRTHVLYELANEPVAWAPEDYGPAAISFQKQVFAKIRQKAPQTYVLLWSFSHLTTSMKSTVDKAPGIDYSNAAVAFHLYGPYALNGLNALQAAYPVIDTEIGGDSTPSTYHHLLLQRVQDAETIGHSWLFLNGVKTTVGPGANNPAIQKWEVFWPADPGAVDLP